MAIPDPGAACDDRAVRVMCRFADRLSDWIHRISHCGGHTPADRPAVLPDSPSQAHDVVGFRRSGVARPACAELVKAL